MSKPGRGGKRLGAGRPTGSGRFGDRPLAKVALPIELRDEVIRFAVGELARRAAQKPTNLGDKRQIQSRPSRRPPSPPPPIRVPFYQYGVRAGLASDADPTIDSEVDLNELLVRHESDTFMLRVEGDSMTEAGIFDDDMLIVDRSMAARHGDIVIAQLNDTEFTCKRLYKRTDRLALIPENPAYSAIEISPGQNLNICGVVTGVIRKLK